MTDEQIEQNAEEYAKKHYDIPFEDDSSMNVIVSEESYIAGAHSRDDEIEHKNTAIKELGKVCGDLLVENLNLKTDLYKLQNPWISVKNHLPEIFVDSKGIIHDFSVKVLVTNENNPNYWHVAEYYPDKNEWCCLEHPTYIIDNVTHWMSIPNIH